MSSSTVLPKSLPMVCAELGRRAAQALSDKFPAHPALSTELPLLPASKPEFGDLQVNACLQLAKPLGQKPRELAQLVEAALKTHPAVAKTEIAGPGYVNVHLTDEFVSGCLHELASDPHHGIEQLHRGKSVVVDYSSPNIAKPMHIGHIRSTIIGAALQRIFAAVGYRVIADNHLGDWGTQFGKLIVAYRNWLDEAAFARDPIGELVRLYQKFVTDEKAQADALSLARPAKADDDDEDDAVAEVTPLLAAARAELAKLQKGDPENLALWKRFVTVSLAEFDKTYARLGVVFDTVYGESHFHPATGSARRGAASKRDRRGEPWRRDLQRRRSARAAADPQGRRLVSLRHHRSGDDRAARPRLSARAHPLRRRHAPAAALSTGVLRRSQDGLYAARWSTSASARCALRTRTATTPRAAPAKAMCRCSTSISIWRRSERAEVARQKSAELSEAELSEVARVVGIGAIKYSDLSRDRQQDIHFDLDKALALDGNTAPYMQYAYARLRSIARKAQAEGFQTADAVTLVEPAERRLGRRLLDYATVVETTARTARPHHLCEYLFDLAGVVSTFYTELPVLKAEPAVRASRLALLALVAKTLRHGLALLGIEVPERM
jgi:arginyl-tRNA synthetase